MKSDNPLVSILLNCYNAEKFISKAVESVLSQTYVNWELIIWDDGSTDKTLEVVKRYKSEKIFIYEQKVNLGLGKSRIAAVKKLKGELISILDADDFFHNDKISRQVEIFKKNKNISICSTWSKILDSNNKLYRIFASQMSNDQLKNRLNFINTIPHPSIMYRRKDAEEVGWYSDKLEYAQDYDLTLKLLNKGDIHIIKEHLTTIFQPDNNMSKSFLLKETVLRENILISENILKTKNLNNKELSLLNTIIAIYSLKLNFHLLKKGQLKSIIILFKIFLLNPFIFSKLNTLEKLDEKKIITKDNNIIKT
ncbi:glycosyltransferase [Candidatus Pelagibacter bacterium]|jgi:glycosyltransferase involved in cell wall biosynthesis|nr:glycosyltransferase [Candidatus Pelagibacter bacterium]